MAAKASEETATAPVAVADDEELPSIITFSEDIASAEQPELLPLGDYPAEIRRVEQRESQAGNMYAAVAFFITPEDYPADYDAENAPDGTTLIYRNVPLADNAQNRWKMRKFCETIGAPPPNRQLDLQSWIGLSAQLSLVHDTWEGEDRAQIGRINPA